MGSHAGHTLVSNLDLTAFSKGKGEESETTPHPHPALPPGLATPSSVGGAETKGQAHKSNLCFSNPTSIIYKNV